VIATGIAGHAATTAGTGPRAGTIDPEKTGHAMIGHAMIGTGTFPMRNGFVDEYIRVNGRMQKPNENGPGFLLDPTIADLYDAAMDNEPKVGGIATLAAHIMMMGHGAQWGGGDPDIAVTREKEFAETAGAESVSWNLTTDMAPFYELPDYVNDLPPLSEYVDDVDRTVLRKLIEYSIATLRKRGFEH